MHQNPTFVPFALALAIGVTACGGKTSSTLPTAPTASSPAPSVATPVAPVTVTSITIVGINTLSGRGETGRLSALVSYDDGTMIDRTSTSRWTSGNQAVVTIDSEGVVTAVGDGQTTITAEFGPMSAAKTIRVDLP